MVDIYVHLKDSSQPKEYLGAINLYRKDEFINIKKADGKYVAIPLEHIHSIKRAQEVSYTLPDKEKVELWLRNSALPVLTGEFNSQFTEAGCRWLIKTSAMEPSNVVGAKTFLEITGFPIDDIYEVKFETIKKVSKKKYAPVDMLVPKYKEPYINTNET